MCRIDRDSINGKRIRPHEMSTITSLFLLLFLMSSASFAVTTTYQYDALNRLQTSNTGNGYLETYAYDGVGNRTSLTVADIIPPTCTLGPSQVVISNGNATITGTASDLGSGVQKVEISLDGGQTWQIATGTANWSYTWAASAGTYDVSVRTTDNDTNTSILAAPVTVSPQIFTLTVSTIGSGTGIITSVPVGISCGATCAAPYEWGTSVVLSVSPNVGSTFITWLASMCSGNGTCTTTVNSDQSIWAILSPTKNDFNFDGKADIVWRNTSNGQNSVWYMDGVTRTGTGQLPTLAGTNYTFAGTGDFNFDGKPDIVWRNTSNGQNSVWYMDGLTQTGTGQFPTQTGSNWIIIAIDDFNFDGKPDIVWRNTSNGQNSVWYMDGVTQIGTGQLPTLSGSNCTFAGTGDFNFDGKPDIVWRNTSKGENYVWYMDGVTQTGTGQFPTLKGSSYTLAGINDFNNDGKPDIVWRNTSNGQNTVWYMDGVTRTGTDQLPTQTGSNWIIVGR